VRSPCLRRTFPGQALCLRLLTGCRFTGCRLREKEGSFVLCHLSFLLCHQRLQIADGSLLLHHLPSHLLALVELSRQVILELADFLIRLLQCLVQRQRPFIIDQRSSCALRCSELKLLRQVGHLAPKDLRLSILAGCPGFCLALQPPSFVDFCLELQLLLL